MSISKHQTHLLPGSFSSSLILHGRGLFTEVTRELSMVNMNATKNKKGSPWFCSWSQIGISLATCFHLMASFTCGFLCRSIMSLVSQVHRTMGQLFIEVVELFSSSFTRNILYYFITKSMGIIPC
jgi:hypothetical protein